MYGDGLCIVGDSDTGPGGPPWRLPMYPALPPSYWRSHPQFTPDDVSQVLRVSADDVETPGFDLLSGAGRVNALKALGVNSVPRVRITGPLAPVNVRNASTVTINGDAYGADFARYRLYYATLDKTFSSGKYYPTAGSWQTLGARYPRA